MGEDTVNREIQKIAPIVTFRVTGEFAHFRSPFVTSYLSTYPFPPKPTILGMFGAILGYSPERVLTLQNKVQIAIKLNKPPKKALDYIRLWKFEEGDKRIQLSPVKMELLVQPDYTIFVHSEDLSFITELQKRLETRDFVYPISFGKNEFIAFIREVYTFEQEHVALIQTSTIDSILPLKLASHEIVLPDLTTNNWATVGLVPVELELVSESGARRVKKTGTFAYSLNGKPIKIQKEIQALEVGPWKVVMF
ncbi:MAG: CRISPR-associated protein Cas5h [Kosmotoga sp.]|nr:CRISPR-associated protein Cas5h [Kosmotoga sp.]